MPAMGRPEMGRVEAAGDTWQGDSAPVVGVVDKIKQKLVTLIVPSLVLD
jgi:hypothetical protein